MGACKSKSKISTTKNDTVRKTTQLSNNSIIDNQITKYSFSK